MTDPYRIVADAFCPHCGVKGRLLAEFETRYEGGDYDMESVQVEVRSCVECGAFHDAPGIGLDGWLKEQRIQFARVQEGRPYEPPPPVQREPSKLSETMGQFDKLLRDTCSSDRVYALSLGTWTLPTRAAPARIETADVWRSLIGSMPDLPEPEDE